MKDYFVSCAQMKFLERNTDAAGLSYYQMMENAGTIAANRIVEITMTSPINDVQMRTARNLDDPSRSPSRYAYQLERPIRARVYCGKGNNGGDGFVVARLLHRRGWQVSIVLVDGEPSTPDAIVNWELAMGLGIPMEDRTETAPKQTSIAASSETPKAISTAAPGEPPDVVVDAIYGTGFHGQLRERGAAASAEIADAKAGGARVFALDIPSGMGGDLTEEAELDERCVRADVTITFHAKKPVHLQPFAEKYCGQIITADIGIVDPAAKNLDPRLEESYTFEDFVDIVSRLRAPEGCPWDRAQTHQTLKKYLLEETQEAIDAIDSEDDENFCEELGDVLLQIVLNSQLAKERNAFTIDEVIQGISEKMIRRHPWVFGDMHVDTPEEGERLWEEIKRREKQKKD